MRLFMDHFQNLGLWRSLDLVNLNYFGAPWSTISVRSIAQSSKRQMMRVGLYLPVHVKAIRRQNLRLLLTHRKLLQSKWSSP
jgi:hypothetical protein